MSKIEGISAETVEAVKRAIYHQEPITMPDANPDESGEWTRELDFEQLDEEDLHLIECQTFAAITVLLASSEVVLRKDVEELIAASRGVLPQVYIDAKFRGTPPYQRLREALAKFTTKPTIGE